MKRDISVFIAWKHVVSAVVLMLLFGASSNAQMVDPETAFAHPDSLNNLPFVDLSNAAKAHANLNIPSQEAIRAKQYDMPRAQPLFNEHDPEKSVQIRTYGRFAHNGGHDPLPTKDADIVAIGQVTSEVPHLTETATAIYSTITFSPTSYLKAPNTLLLKPLMLERMGGVVLFPSGKKEFRGNLGMGIPLPGYSYLLFLKSSVSGDSYTILAGYALGEPHAIALDNVDRSVEATSPATLIEQVKAKVSAQ